MSQYHPLTEKLYERFKSLRVSNDSIIPDDDKIIRDYLEEAAEKIYWQLPTTTHRSKIRETLGLTEVKEEPDVCHCPNGNSNGHYHFGKISPMPKELKPCDCMVNPHSYWKFCPLCGIPRPTEKNLRERLAEKFDSISTRILHYHDKEGRTSEEQVIHKARFLEMADIALTFMRENKE